MESQAPASAKTILLVDDEESMRQVLERRVPRHVLQRLLWGKHPCEFANIQGVQFNGHALLKSFNSGSEFGLSPPTGCIKAFETQRCDQA